MYFAVMKSFQSYLGHIGVVTFAVRQGVMIHTMVSIRKHLTAKIFFFECQIVKILALYLNLRNDLIVKGTKIRITLK
jgi:hypothetical protein